MGENFQALVAFLMHASLINSSSTTPISTSTHAIASRPDERDFALYYSLKDLKDSPKPTSLPSPLLDLSFTSPNGKMGGALVFLIGYPSQDWILQLGAAYNIDPEFFRVHLGFLNRQGEQLYDFPRLPSYRRSLFQLHITSIGIRHVPDYHNIQERRDRAEELMRVYIKGMRDFSKWKQGDSIVREYAEHDASAYSIQQTITICMCRPQKQRGKTKEDWTCMYPWLLDMVT